MKKKVHPKKISHNPPKSMNIDVNPHLKKKLTAGKTQKIVFEMLQNGPKIVEKKTSNKDDTINAVFYRTWNLGSSDGEKKSPKIGRR